MATFHRSISELVVDSGEPMDGFIFYECRPFHPHRIWLLLQKNWQGVSRIKGFVWLADCPDRVGLWTYSGGISRSCCAGRWWAARSEEEWPSSQAIRDEIRRCWHCRHGDRRQEIAFIGRGFDRDVIVADLRAALLTDDEMLCGEEMGWEYYAASNISPLGLS